MTDKKADQAKDAEKDEALTEDEASVNPVETPTLQANYDPTGQIQQPGQPLHSTDPEEQAAYEQERQEAISRSQLGANYVEPGERDEKDRENS